MYIVNPLKSRPMQQSMPSSAWLLPYEQYWPNGTVFVETAARNYTARDYKQFFHDMDYETG